MNLALLKTFIKWFVLIRFSLMCNTDVKFQVNSKRPSIAPRQLTLAPASPVPVAVTLPSLPIEMTAALVEPAAVR